MVDYVKKILLMKSITLKTVVIWAVYTEVQQLKCVFPGKRKTISISTS